MSLTSNWTLFFDCSVSTAQPTPLSQRSIAPIPELTASPVATEYPVVAVADVGFAGSR